MQPEFQTAAMGVGAVGLETDDPLIYRALVSPKRQAVVDVATGRAETYGQLDEAVGRGAALIAKLTNGLPLSQRIAFLGRNSIEQITVCLACQRAGRVSEVVEIVWRRNLRVNQHPPNRRRQPPGRSRHEAEYR
ncbi:MAG: AMP-binding protein, partial [Allorhizobium sp.]